MIRAQQARELRANYMPLTDLLTKAEAEIRLAASNGRSSTNIPLIGALPNHHNRPENYPERTKQLLSALRNHGFRCEVVVDETAPTEVWIEVAW